MHCRYVMCYDTTCFQRNNLIIFTSARVDLSPAGGQCFREGPYRLTTIGFSIKWRDCFAFITLSPLCILHVIECTHLLHICVQRLMQPCLHCSSSHVLPFSCTIMEKNIFNTAWIYAVLKNRGLHGKCKVLHQRGWRALWYLRLLFCLKENAWQLFSVPLHSVISFFFLFHFHLHARTVLVLFGSGFLQWVCSGYWGGFIRWLQKLWLTAENTAVAGWEKEKRFDRPVQMREWQCFHWCSMMRNVQMARKSRRCDVSVLTKDRRAMLRWTKRERPLPKHMAQTNQVHFCPKHVTNWFSNRHLKVK